MIKRISILVVVALVALGGLCFAVGESATDFSLKDFNGKEFRLSDHLGDKVVIMSFWMSWCKPCQVEMPQLQELYNKYKDKGLLVVSINADDPSGVAKAKSIVRQKKLTYPVLFDSDTKVTGLYNPNKAFPYTVVIDKNKKIVHVKTGFSAGDEKHLEEIVTKALAGQEVN